MEVEDDRKKELDLKTNSEKVRRASFVFERKIAKNREKESP